jgi:hypothetical protein
MSERAAYWRRMLGAWAASGLSQAEFCRRQQLKAVTFAWWKRRLQGRDAGPRPGCGRGARRVARAAFVEVALPQGRSRSGLSSSGTPRETAGGYELALPGGACLHLPADFDVERIAQLVQVLARAC